MKSKHILLIFFSIIIVLFVGSWFHYKGQASDLREKLRIERETNAEVIRGYDSQIGEYVSSLGTLSDNLKKEQDLTKDQKRAIDLLERSLHAKVTEIASLTAVLDTINNSGNATVIVKGDTVTYTINEKTQGVGLDLTLNHPQGNYKYTILHDPIAMEIFMAKEKGTGYKFSSVRFPNQPWIYTSTLSLYYDPDIRNWWQRFIDNTSIRLMGVVGEANGVGASVGYKRIHAGRMFMEDGNGIFVQYDLKGN